MRFICTAILYCALKNITGKQSSFLYHIFSGSWNKPLGLSIDVPEDFHIKVDHWHDPKVHVGWKTKLEIPLNTMSLRPSLVFNWKKKNGYLHQEIPWQIVHRCEDVKLNYIYYIVSTVGRNKQLHQLIFLMILKQGYKTIVATFLPQKTIFLRGKYDE